MTTDEEEELTEISVEEEIKEINDIIGDSKNMSKLDEENNGWNLDITESFREYAWKAAGLSWMHGEDAAAYNSRNTKINIILSCLSVLSAVGIAGSFVFVNGEECDEVKSIGFYILSGINIILNLIMAMLGGYRLAAKLDRKISDHSELSSKFEKLYRKIKAQFALSSQKRMNAVDFSIYLQDRFDELDREKPFIRNKTVKSWGRYRKKLKVDAKAQQKDYSIFIKMPAELRPKRDMNDIPLNTNIINDVNPKKKKKKNDIKRIHNWIDIV
jgi:hypothetical protein